MNLHQVPCVLEVVGRNDSMTAGQGVHEGSPQSILSCSKHTSLDVDATANNMLRCGGQLMVSFLYREHILTYVNVPDAEAVCALLHFKFSIPSCTGLKCLQQCPRKEVHSGDSDKHTVLRSGSGSRHARRHALSADGLSVSL